MRRTSELVLMLSGVLLMSCSSGKGLREASAGLNSQLRQELLAMEQADQKLRWSLTSKATPTQLAEVVALDARHTARMKQIIQEYGWPGYSLVGQDGAGAAWLLIQHADKDPQFQAQCLRLMEVAVSKGEASRREYAYLLDRVRMNAGQPQVYGTQFRWNSANQLEPYPIENPGEVEQRRRAVGLEPLSEYERELKTMSR